MRIKPMTTQERDNCIRKLGISRAEVASLVGHNLRGEIPGQVAAAIRLLVFSPTLREKAFALKKGFPSAKITAVRQLDG